ncbi:MAG: Ig-like domain-containing protein, partial [Spirochaetes bacterium]|nr:Ig-like domain-containing protein [Spirochaetota bacterium]
WDTIVYPPNNYTIAKASWSGNESPDPLPPNTNKPLGSPISIIFNKKLIKVISSELLNDQNNNVPCFVVSSSTDINNKNINGVVLVPKVILNYNTKYTVKIKAGFENNEEKDYIWSFITEQQK